MLRGLIDQRERVLNPVLLVVLGCQLGAATIVAVLVEGLRRLEYRGYDSAGVAVLGLAAPAWARGGGHDRRGR